MLKAIQVKKQLNGGSEASDEIAYLYNELAVTYHSNDDFESAVKCVKKQIAIFDHLSQTSSMEYAQLVSYLGELYRDLEQPLEAIDALERAVGLHETACETHAESLEADKD